MGPIRDVLPNNINTSKKPMMEPGQLTFLATVNKMQGLQQNIICLMGKATVKDLV